MSAAGGHDAPGIQAHHAEGQVQDPAEDQAAQGEADEVRQLVACHSRAVRRCAEMVVCAGCRRPTSESGPRSNETLGSRTCSHTRKSSCVSLRRRCVASSESILRRRRTSSRHVDMTICCTGGCPQGRKAAAQRAAQEGTAGCCQARKITAGSAC